MTVVDIIKEVLQVFLHDPEFCIICLSSDQMKKSVAITQFSILEVAYYGL